MIFQQRDLLERYTTITPCMQDTAITEMDDLLHLEGPDEADK
jgi:hypothetical protein